MKKSGEVVKIRCEWVDLHQSRTVRWAWAPASGSEANALKHHGMRELVCEDFLWEHEWVTEPNLLWKENDILEALNYDI